MRYFKYNYIVIVSVFFLVSSCKKLNDFGDTNTNPDAINTASPEGLLTATLANVASTTLTSGIYVQYFQESQYPSASFYEDNSSDFTGYYSGVLSYLQRVKSLGYAGSTTNNMVQVAKILQQYIYFNITNQWGAVPYSKALLGSSNTTPEYDDQKTIYEGIIATLRASVDSIDESAISGDIAYDGDANAWKKLGNSVIMLASVQMSKVYPNAGDYAATSFSTALASSGGYITSNDDNFAIDYPSTTYPNPWYTLYYTRSDYGECETLTDLMSGLGDTRQAMFGGANSTPGDATTSSLGLPSGVTRDEVVTYIATYPGWARILRGDWRNYNSSLALLTASYVTLIRAEAANLGWTGETASSLYETGIGLSFSYWGATMPSGYLSQSDVTLGTDNIKKIAVQQYIAAYPNGYYGWNIWRKTGYPVLTPSANAANASGKIPRRIKYATSEATSNAASYAAAVAALDGGNSDVARMWWDVE